MATEIILKKSTVEGKIPLASDLSIGELAVNLFDKKLYSKDSSDVILDVVSAGGSTVSNVDPTENTNPALIGATWINEVTGNFFVCTDITTDANTWFSVRSNLQEIPLILTLINVLIIGGGGGGGGDNSGGGGAGGLIYLGTESPNIGGVFAVPADGFYTVTVGAGGTGSPSVNASAEAGGNSSLVGDGINLVSIGGGSAGTGQSGERDGGPGGSGGGSGSESGDGAIGQAQQSGSASGGFGSNGGFGTNGAGGGGGGASSVGEDGNVQGTGFGGDGGFGLEYSISGSAQFYAAGGNAGGDNGDYNTRPRVNGVGGTANDSSGTAPTAGVNGTGSGGGGLTYNGQTTTEGSVGGFGGSGVVIISYPVDRPNAETTGDPLISEVGGNRIYTFVNSGTITF
jgi:hypothetical protein